MPGFGEAASLIADGAVGVRFTLAVRSFVRSPVSTEIARQALAGRLAHRSDSFLDLLRRAVYARPRSPYRQLLSLAGLEYGDVERLVKLEGLEGALARLAGAGVYLTVDEMRGREPARRGSAAVDVERATLRNLGRSSFLQTQSSGSSGAARPMLVDLESLRAQAGNHRLVLEARGLVGSRYGHWGVPGSAALGRLLQFAIIGGRPTRWFSQVDAASPGLHPRYRWSTRALIVGSRLAGSPLPSPEYVPASQPAPIVKWLADTLRFGEVPHFATYPSSALRICQVAREMGLDLTGAHFTVTGEPMTEARLEGIRAAGSSVYPAYGSSETGLMGWGCLRPSAADDMHLSEDMHALIQWSETDAGGGLPNDALLVTSLQPTARLIMLNVSLGDQAQRSRQGCKCPLEAMGWPTHLRSIRSFEKLTAGGMTFLDSDVIRILEQILPSRFGGGPTDYQVVEQEESDGTPTLRLVVHPALGPLDEHQVAEAFLAAIGRGSGVERVMELQWRQAGTLRVERRVPLTTPSGKLLHLHRVRGAVAARSG